MCLGIDYLTFGLAILLKPQGTLLANYQPSDITSGHTHVPEVPLSIRLGHFGHTESAVPSY